MYEYESDEKEVKLNLVKGYCLTKYGLFKSVIQLEFYVKKIESNWLIVFSNDITWNTSLT